MGYIQTVAQYLETIENPKNKEIFNNLLNWVQGNFDLILEIRYNQPMFIKNGTFILAISNLKNHISIAPEYDAMLYFKDEILLAGYQSTMMLFKIKYNEDINYNLLTRMINYKLEEKQGYLKFWKEKKLE